MKNDNQNNVIEFSAAKSAEQAFMERLTMIGADERDEVLRRISAAVAEKRQQGAMQISA